MSKALTLKDVTLRGGESALGTAAFKRFKNLLRAPMRGGGLRRRFLAWSLSFFGVILTLVVIAAYTYTERQIRRDSAQMQVEIATVTADRINGFVKRKVERFSDTANAINLYPMG